MSFKLYIYLIGLMASCNFVEVNYSKEIKDENYELSCMWWGGYYDSVNDKYVQCLE